jgi:NAD-dependent deacetylase
MAKVVIFSGAGISAESGISTFRDTGGLWDNYEVTEICYFDSLEKNESTTLKFYDKRRAELSDKEPNYAHLEVAKLKKRYPNDIAIITQNIDDMFEKAGLRDDEIIHLHGFLPQVRCRECEAIFDIKYASIYDYNSGHCTKCSAKLRPDVVFFGEQAPFYAKFDEEIQDCEFFVVIGTSGYVIGVNTIANFVDNTILNNLEPSEVISEHLFDKVIYDKASNAIDEIVDDIEEFLA